MSGNEAIPISKTALLNTLKNLEAEAVETAEQKEARLYADLAMHEGWEMLKKRIENKIERLRELADAIEGTETVETIGFKFLASRVAIAHLKGIIDLVEATHQHVREQRSEQSK